MLIKHVGIIKKSGLEEAGRLGVELANWFAERSVTTVFDSISEEMDLVVILGGDGTLLHVAEQAACYQIPVVGINLGSLGFLTEVAIKERYIILETLLRGSAAIEDRMMLKARIHSDGKKSDWRFALNDVVVSRGILERLVRLVTWADREYITTYKADGLIFSTPTGSTAYNLSSGGPIVHPGLAVILVTPICPFMLESRPLLLPADCRLITKSIEARQEVSVIIDGQPVWMMKNGDELEVVAAGKPLKLICSSREGYFDILRNKLNWGGIALEEKKS